ncbi:MULTISPECIES: hypothetical protein [unclassified Lysobacter]|uniref:hypothetical protein n=1 Tax=unclassified Lysobacter TaxID=2635362 RepID=UPI000708BE6C|nr:MULTISPECIES: hypothetical protein [unclassified Lysobacter]KRD39342.1 hypothetical protein ASE35_03000 [Lysobacter sp. Root916]KRD74514.1 hypothetical protein ASE43_14825 [Lysobacter sp. Root983]
MAKWHPFRYKEFWDQPRAIYTSDGKRSFFLDCSFDEELDEYPDRYKVYLMPELDELELAGSWADLERKALAQLGTVDLPRTALDPTLRKLIDFDIFDHLLPL